MAHALVSLCLLLASATTAAAACLDATLESNRTCFKNIEWAKNDGIVQDPSWYKSFPFLSNESSLKEFQLALSVRGPSDERSHNCTTPCLPEEELKTYVDQIVTEREAEGKVTGALMSFGASLGNSSAVYGAMDDDFLHRHSALILWGVILGVCCGIPCCGLLCSVICCYQSVSWIFRMCGGEEKPQKKKRAVKLTKEAQAPPAAAPPPAAPVLTIAQPLMTAMPVPVSMPVVHQAAPVVVHHSAAPPVYAAAAPATTAAPVYYAAAPPTYH